MSVVWGTMWLVISWEFDSLNPFFSLALAASGRGPSHVMRMHKHVSGEVVLGAVGDLSQNVAVAIFRYAETA